MHECELCGRKTDTAYVVEIDNVELGVCARCAKGRHIISEISDPKRRTVNRSANAQAPVPQRDEDRQVVENYGQLIRAARERMKLPLRVLAEMLNEKEGLLSRVEEQKTLPPEGLRKKLERALRISLLEPETSEKASYQNTGRKEAATLGEFMN